jgi:hypothetical protein
MFAIVALCTDARAAQIEALPPGEDGTAIIM